MPRPSWFLHFFSTLSVCGFKCFPFMQIFQVAKPTTNIYRELLCARDNYRCFSCIFFIFTVNLRCRHQHHNHHHCHHHRHHHHYRSHLINEEAEAQTGKCCCQWWHQDSNPGGSFHSNTMQRLSCQDFVCFSLVVFFFFLI